MNTPYHPKTIEADVQSLWALKKTFSVDNAPHKPAYYCLSMLPYPSGQLHMGHVRNYLIGDIIARYKRMQGYAVLHPIGWDAFGLPAENAAIEQKRPPETWTQLNIAAMREQFERLGLSFDWDREISTADPTYFRWEQWFFLKLYEKGLAYQKEQWVNWCPKDQTVLANEQVVQGECWRCGSAVEKRSLKQWFLRMSDYAPVLLKALDALPGWPKQVIKMQKNWIGEQKGLQIAFPCDAERQDLPLPITSIPVFSTRPETLFGVSFLAVSAQHPLVRAYRAHCQDEQLIHELRDIERRAIEVVQAREEIKTVRGLRLPYFSKNPKTGEKLSIWVTDYVLDGYATGAVMGVPAHDARDHRFATRYNLPIRSVLESSESDVSRLPYELKSGRLIESDFLNGLTVEEAAKRITEQLVAEGIAECQTFYRLKDWGVSRQRYWGAPIPMAQTTSGDWVPIPEGDLPVTLPPYEANRFDKGNPLEGNHAWRTIEIDGKILSRLPETFDTFFESSWYYARYTCPNYAQGMLDPKATQLWLPVDHYVGGIEHATMHLLYFRFFHRLLKEIGLVPSEEPVKRLICQGMVIGPAYYRLRADGTQEWVEAQSVRESFDATTQTTHAYDAEGNPLICAGHCKMSKSKKNGVEPSVLIENYGADAVRLFTAFAAPPDAALVWNAQGLCGAHRFLSRLWQLVHQITTLSFPESDVDPRLAFKAEALLKKVTYEYEERCGFNSVVAALMEFLNMLQTAIQQGHLCHASVIRYLTLLVQLLNPISPHITTILWGVLGQTAPIETASWPSPNRALTKDAPRTVVIQLNGKKIAAMEVPADALSEAQVTAQALADPKVALKVGQGAYRVIYRSGRVLNFVLHQ